MSERGFQFCKYFEYFLTSKTRKDEHINQDQSENMEQPRIAHFYDNRACGVDLANVRVVFSENFGQVEGVQRMMSGYRPEMMIKGAYPSRRTCDVIGLERLLLNQASSRPPS